MKIFFGGCIVFLFLSNHCTAQLGQPIPVPVLKEDKKVDDLMDKIFKNEQDSGQVDKSLLSDSCWVINMYRLDKGDDFDVDLIRNSKSVINYRVCRYAYYKAKYGCFIYKGNKIFVWAKDEFGSLFTAASTYQKFNFIFYSNDTHATEPELYAGVLHYQFKKGRFSLGGLPPTIEEQIK